MACRSCGMPTSRTLISGWLGWNPIYGKEWTNKIMNIALRY